MYPKDKNHFSAKIIFPKNSNKKAFHVKRTNFKKKNGKWALFPKMDVFEKKNMRKMSVFFPKMDVFEKKKLGKMWKN